MIWLLLLIPLSQAAVPGIAFSISSVEINEGIQNFTPYVIDILDNLTVPVIYEEFSIALIKVKANLTDFSLHDIEIDLANTNVAFKSPNIVEVSVQGVAFKAYTAYNIRYGLLDYTDKNCTVTTSKASLDISIEFTETKTSKPQFNVKSIQLKLGKLDVQTHKWYNGTINAFIKVNKGIIENIVESHIKDAFKDIDKTLAAADWAFKFPRTNAKIDLRYFGTPSVQNSSVLYVPLNATIFS